MIQPLQNICQVVETLRSEDESNAIFQDGYDFIRLYLELAQMSLRTACREGSLMTSHIALAFLISQKDSSYSLESLYWEGLSDGQPMQERTSRMVCSTKATCFLAICLANVISSTNFAHWKQG